MGFSRKIVESDYSSLLNDISNLEINNENVDSKTSQEKLAVLRKLKESIEKSGILKINTDDKAHKLIQSFYYLLYTRQSDPPKYDFPESYYAVLSDVLSNAKSYSQLVLPYEKILSEKMAELQTLAHDASKNDEQKRMSAILSQRMRPLRTAMLAIMLGLTAIGCDIRHNIDLKSTDGSEYTINQDAMEHYIVKDGSLIKPSELGSPFASRGGTFTPKNGGPERIEYISYDFDGKASRVNYNGHSFDIANPDIIAAQRSTGQIIMILVHKDSKFYNKILKKLGKRVYKFEPKYKLF